MHLLMVVPFLAPICHNLLPHIQNILTVPFGSTVIFPLFFHASCPRVGILPLHARLIPLSRVTAGLVSPKAKASYAQATHLLYYPWWSLRLHLLPTHILTQPSVRCGL